MSVVPPAPGGAAKGAPYFTVVIPSYNAEAFLADALRSVRAQTYSDFECIVVDDGSTDGSVSVARSFESDKRFRVIPIDHGASPGRARNRAVAAARGEYVAFLDADDVWTPQKLGRAQDLIRARDARLIFTNGYVVDEKLRRISPLLSDGMPNVLPTRDPLLLITNIVPVPSVVVRRDVLGSDPFLEDVRFRGMEDYALWLRLHADIPFVYDPARTLLYRCHTGQMHRDRERELDKWEELLQAQDPSGTYGADAVQLCRELIAVRRHAARGDRVATVLAVICLAHWGVKRERRALGRYLRYGLAVRLRTLRRQRRSGSVVGV